MVKIWPLENDRDARGEWTEWTAWCVWCIGRRQHQIMRILEDKLRGKGKKDSEEETLKSEQAHPSNNDKGMEDPEEETLKSEQAPSSNNDKGKEDPEEETLKP